ncbi:MAG TPA: DUF6082 family protein, partial [Streptosporangiaceae bacterium]|nr:DUF6082 family protein [Streptosporangiaceae bacterium]
WGPVPTAHDATDRKQQMYVNMIVSEWQMSFETKALGEPRLRAISNEMFQGAVGRLYWESARKVRLATSETRRARRFHQLLDEEYKKAPFVPTKPPSAGAAGRPRRWVWPLLAGLATALAAAVPTVRAMATRCRR